MLTIVGGDYEHTLDLAADDAGLLYQTAKLPPVWAGVRDGKPFDAVEFSLANLMMMHDRGSGFLFALPIFPSVCATLFRIVGDGSSSNVVSAGTASAAASP